MRSAVVRIWLGLAPQQPREQSANSRITPLRTRQAIRHAFDPRNLWVVAVVPDALKFRTEILNGATSYQYPSWVDRRELRKLDQEYLAYRPIWEAKYIKALKADELFR